MQVKMVITGDKEINRLLAELPVATQRKFVRLAARPAIKALLPTVRRNVPVRSGALRKSLGVRSIPKSRTRIGLMVTTRGGWFVGKTFYGAFQEWGWRAGRRTTKRRKGDTNVEDKRTKVPGKFYAKKSTDSKRQSILTIYRRGLRQLLSEEAARAHIKRVMP